MMCDCHISFGLSSVTGKTRRLTLGCPIPQEECIILPALTLPLSWHFGYAAPIVNAKMASGLRLYFLITTPLSRGSGSLGSVTHLTTAWTPPTVLVPSLANVSTEVPDVMVFCGMALCWGGLDHLCFHCAHWVESRGAQNNYSPSWINTQRWW